MIIDCHVHIFDPERFPYLPHTIYTPAPEEAAPVEKLDRILQHHDVNQAVLVAPMAGYFTDNRCLMHALRHGSGRYRGIAIVGSDVSDRKLDEMESAGVVGARFDLISLGTDYLQAIRTSLLKRLIDRDWIIDLQCEADQLTKIPRVFETGGRFVIDHGGRPIPEAGLNQPGFRALLDVAATGRVWVKLSGPFRASRQPFPHADMDPFFEALIAKFGPSRLIWGSDWPFVRLMDKPDYAMTLRTLKRWIPLDADRSTVITDTPSALFGWTSDV